MIVVARVLLTALLFVSWGAARAEPSSEATLAIMGRGKGVVSVRGVGFERKAKLGDTVTLPAGAGVIVRVDFAANDFYETFLELGAGEFTLDVPDASAVKGGALVAGKKKIPLSRGLALTSYTSDKAWSFAGMESPDGLPMFGRRESGPGKPPARIDQVLLHATLTRTARTAFNALVARSLSSHLFIERDGTIIQALNLETCAYHAGEANAQSIGLDLVGELQNLAKRVAPVDVTPAGAELMTAEDVAMAADVGGDPNAGVTDPRLSLPIGPTLVINGARVQAYGYSERAMRALEGVLLALWRAYPAIGRAMAADLATLPDPFAPGVVTHWQTEPQRWDPGPGFDVARIQRLAALVRALEAR